MSSWLVPLEAALIQKLVNWKSIVLRVVHLMIPFVKLKAGTYRNLALMAIGLLWEFMFNVEQIDRHRCDIVF